jgi:MOSC domain-containing protein YiiM
VAVVVAVNRSAAHEVTKRSVETIRLIAGHGVEDDAHFGTTVQHQYLKRKDPAQPNLRQVHVIGAELFDEVASVHAIGPGDIGENITTRGIDLQNLAQGTRLHIGATAVVEVTGLRDPCGLIDRVRPGLRAAVTSAPPTVAFVRHAIMGIVAVSGDVKPGDSITVEHPPEPHRPLAPI